MVTLIYVVIKKAFWNIFEYRVLKDCKIFQKILFNGYKESLIGYNKNRNEVDSDVSIVYVG